MGRIIKKRKEEKKGEEGKRERGTEVKTRFRERGKSKPQKL